MICTNPYCGCDENAPTPAYLSHPGRCSSYVDDGQEIEGRVYHCVHQCTKTAGHPSDVPHGDGTMTW